jgi:PKD repeat protein
VPTGPAAAFDYTPQGLSVAFTDQSTAGDAGIVNWQWDFGDGNGSTEQHPMHEYAWAGAYTVSLTVTDGNGQSDSVSEVLSVSEETADYCPASGVMYQVQWIANVQMGDFARASQASGYSDFTGDIVEASAGEFIPVVLSHGPASVRYLKSWRVWADFNRDGDFEDDDERLFEGTGTGEISGSISIPSWATEGHTRLRVAMKLGSLPEPCGTFSAGEVEDYTLSISATTH